MTLIALPNRLQHVNQHPHMWIMAISGKKVVCDDACRFAKYAAKPGSRANDMAKSRKVHKDYPNLKRPKRSATGKKGRRK